MAAQVSLNCPCPGCEVETDKLGAASVNLVSGTPCQHKNSNASKLEKLKRPLLPIPKFLS